MHAVAHPTPPFRTRSGNLEVHQIPVWQDNLVWLLVDVSDGTAAAVDGPEAQPVLDYCTAHGFTLTAIFNTHTHMDHIGINVALQNEGTLDSLRVVGSAKTADRIPGLTEPVAEGHAVRFGPTLGRVMLTEGHIDGHVSYLFEDVLFCGDTLFAGGCGYLFDGPPARMHDSLTRLAALPEDTRVCCAHEYTQDNLRFAWSIDADNPALAARIQEVWARRKRYESTVPSTIGEEIRTNPFLRTDAPNLVEAVRRALPEHPLTTPAEIFAATRALKDRKDYRDQSDDVLPIVPSS